jgi:tetratricopeptide (TPR) repeat protein
MRKSSELSGSSMRQDGPTLAYEQLFRSQHSLSHKKILSKKVKIWLMAVVFLIIVVALMLTIFRPKIQQTYQSIQNGLAKQKDQKRIQDIKQPSNDERLKNYDQKIADAKTNAEKTMVRSEKTHFQLSIDDYAGAVSTAQDDINDNPNDPAAYANLATLYEYASNYNPDQAIANYQKAIDMTNETNSDKTMVSYWQSRIDQLNQVKDENAQ